MTDKDRFQKIKTNDLKVGMFVHDVARGWLSHPWPTKSKLITTEKDIELLKKHGINEVTVDITRGFSPDDPRHLEHGISGKTVAESNQVTPQEISAKVPPENLTVAPRTVEEVERRKKIRSHVTVDPLTIEEELPKARRTYTKTLGLTREFMKDVRTGKKVEVELVQEHVDQMIDSVFRNRDALLALLKLKKYDEYTYTHSLNVTVLAVSFGRQIGFERDELAQLGLGAIFHDVGKQLIPNAIINKPGRLTDEEFRIVQNHPVLGSDLLAKDKKITPLAQQVVRHHHERLDGTGYPDGLKQEQITSFMAISSICDVYDALSSDRVYHRGRLPHEALKIVFSLRDKHFPLDWTDRFIQNLGIYPAGTAVRLNTGEIGIVYAVNRGSLLSPKIRIVMDGAHRLIQASKFLDLSDGSLVDRKILEVINPANFGFNSADYFSAGEAA